MPKGLRHRSVVFLLFLAITGGNALPYAHAFQEATKVQFSCHCCDHGKADCDHCARFGHKLDEKAKQKQAPVFEATPCSKQQQKAQTYSFLMEPFLQPQLNELSCEWSSWELSKATGHLSSYLLIPPTPPPQILS